MSKIVSNTQYLDIIISILGLVGITLSVGWSEPLDPYYPDDLEASERDLSFGHGWFAHPVYINGDYPDIMKWKIGNKSMEQGFNQSRLPEFGDDEKKLVNGELVSQQVF